MEGQITINCDVGEVSDGYHTFNELYAHRCTLFTALMKSHKPVAWKSKYHDDGSQLDGSPLDGWFIAGLALPTGMVTYHLPIHPFWDKIPEIIELERAPAFDGHTSNDVLKRFLEWMV